MKIDGLLAPLHLDFAPYGLISLSARAPGATELANLGDRFQFVYARAARGIHSLRDFNDGPFLCALSAAVDDPAEALFGEPDSLRTLAHCPPEVQAAIRGMQAGFELGVQAAREQFEALLAAMNGSGK